MQQYPAPYYWVKDSGFKECEEEWLLAGYCPFLGPEDTGLEECPNRCRRKTIYDMQRRAEDDLLPRQTIYDMHRWFKGRSASDGDCKWYCRHQAAAWCVKFRFSASDGGTCSLFDSAGTDGCASGHEPNISDSVSLRR